MPNKIKTKNIKEKFTIEQAVVLVRKKLGLAFKFIFVFGLLYFLAKKGFISVEATQQALSQWQKIVPALAMIFFCTLLGVMRWAVLLRAQSIQLSWKRSFQLTMIGNFFNIALPGAVSGDFVKAFYIGKEMKGHRSKAFGSILFDRLTGVSALILVSGGALALGRTSFENSPHFNDVKFLVELGAVCVVVFYAYLFLIQEKSDPLLKIFRSIERKISKFAAITRIYESVRHYHFYRLDVVKALALSVIIHLATGWSCLMFAQALGDTHLSLLSVYIVVPLGLLVTAVPVAPAGIGTGNIAFLYFFGVIGSQRGADIFSLIALTNILIGALGGLVYFRFKSEEPLPSLEA